MVAEKPDAQSPSSVDLTTFHVSSLYTQRTCELSLANVTSQHFFGAFYKMNIVISLFYIDRYLASVVMLSEKKKGIEKNVWKSF